MKPTTLTTVSASPSVSSSSQETKNKQNDKVKKQKGKGRFSTVSGILVNQGLGKIKLEDDIPAPIKMETDTDSCHCQATSEGNVVEETFTEEFVVTKEYISLESPEEPGQDQQDQSSSCTCHVEISSLKDAVKELTLQVQKQNQVITGIKSGLRNAVLSLMTCCQDEKEDGTLLRDTSDSDDQVHESPVIVDTFSKACGPTVGDPLLIDNTDIFPGAHQQAAPLDTQVSYSGESIAVIQGPSASKSSSSNEAGIRSCQNTEDVDMDDEDGWHDDDSSYVPDDSDDESDKETEDEDDHQENQFKITSSKVSSKSNEQPVSTTGLTANSEGRLGCPKCGKKYKTRKSLREHMLVQHSGKRPQIKCPLCSKVFCTRAGVRAHILSVHKGIRYKCPHCPGTFCSRSTLLSHQKSVHKEGGPLPQQCPICGIHLVNSEKALQGHMSTMHKDASLNRYCAEIMQTKSKPETKRTKMVKCQYCSSSFLKLKDLHCHLSQSHGIISQAEAVKLHN